MLVAKPNFHSYSIFQENLVVIQLARTEVIIRQSTYVGLAVLDLSKIRLYRFHYGFMKKQLGNAVDGLYELAKANLYEFDTSDYPAEN